MSRPSDEPIREIVITLTVAEEKPAIAYDFGGNLDEATDEDLMYITNKLVNELQTRILIKAIHRSKE